MTVVVLATNTDWSMPNIHIANTLEDMYVKLKDKYYMEEEVFDDLVRYKFTNARDPLSYGIVTPTYFKLDQC